MKEYLLGLILLMSIGISGWKTFSFAKIPTATIIGSMFFVGAFQIIGNTSISIPAFFNPALQMVIGISIGTSISRDIIKTLRKMILPAIIVSFWWIIVSFGMGYLYYRLGFLDVKTAFLGTAPGGIAEMGMLAVSIGADADKVTLLQFCRLVGVLVIVPIIASMQDKKHNKDTIQNSTIKKKDLESEVKENSIKFSSQRKWVAYLLSILGGIILYITDFPTGGLIGSFVVSGIIMLSGWVEWKVPNKVRNYAQVGLGGIIGLSFTLDTVIFFRDMFGPIMLLTLLFLFNGLLLSVILKKITNWSFETCLLSTSAGGLTPMGMLAHELNADEVVVIILQLVRLLTILFTMPLFTSLMWG